MLNNFHENFRNNCQNACSKIQVLIQNGMGHMEGHENRKYFYVRFDLLANFDILCNEVSSLVILFPSSFPSESIISSKSRVNVLTKLL